MASTAFHLALCLLFANFTDLAVFGPAYATTFANVLQLTLITVYTLFITDNPNIIVARNTNVREAMSLKGLRAFMKEGGISIVQLCLEWWSFEFMTIIAAQLSIEAVAVQIIVINNSNIFYMPQFGLHIAAI